MSTGPERVIRVGDAEPPEGLRETQISFHCSAVMDHQSWLYHLWTSERYVAVKIVRIEGFGR